MANKNMTLRVALKLGAEQFNKGINAVKASIAGIGKYFTGLASIGSAAMFGKAVIQNVKEFEDAMARARAVSNASQTDFKAMEKEARRLGSTTRYTATEVANTLEVLTRNGFNAQKATASLSSVLQLAQANAIELSDAGNMLTNTLNMFGLGVENATRVTDVMSSIASNTATNISDLYDAMVNASPMAHALGISIEETAAALGALAQRGVKGADAGTQLRMMLQKMVDPSSIKKMNKMGIAIDETKIKSEGLKYVLGELSKANLSVSQLNEIFTVRSSKSVLQLVNSVQDFNSILDTVSSSAGTTMRMFEQGVGSVRKEVDILRSAWESFLIDIGSATGGPIKASLVALQDIILSLKTWRGWLVMAGSAYLGFHSKINKGFASLGRGIVAWAQQSTTARKLVYAETMKLTQETIIANAAIIQSEREKAKVILADANKEIAAIKAQQQAVNGLKATMKSIGFAIAAIGLEVLVSKWIEANREMREAKKAIKDIETESARTNSQISLLNQMIGNGSDPNSLNGAVKIATEKFPEFASAIKEAYIEAGNTKNYEKLKTLLKEIGDLQISIMKRKGAEQMMQATQSLVAREMRYSGGEAGHSARKQLRDQGFNKEQIDAVFENIASILIRNDQNLDKNMSELKTYLASMNVYIDNESLKTFVKDNTRKQGTGYWGQAVESNFKKAVDAYASYQKTISDTSADERDLVWKTSYDRYISAVNEAKKKFEEKSDEYNQAVSTAARRLKDDVRNISLSAAQQQKMNAIEDKWITPFEKKEKVTTGDNKSKKKTDFDKFSDSIDDYMKDLEKLQSQLNNGILTQREYASALNKLNLDAVEAIAGVKDLDSWISKLPAKSVEAAKSLKGMIPNYQQMKLMGKLYEYQGGVKAEENKYSHTGKNEADTRAFNDAIDDLSEDVWEDVTAFENLNDILSKLPSEVRTLFDELKSRIDSIRAKKTDEQRRKLSKDYDVKTVREIKDKEHYTKSTDVIVVADTDEAKEKIAELGDENVSIVVNADAASIEDMKRQVDRIMDKDYDLNMKVHDAEIDVKVNDKQIDDTRSKIEKLEEAIRNGDFNLVKDEAISKLEGLKAYLQQLMEVSSTLQQKLSISEYIVKIDSKIKDLRGDTIDSISSMASAFDRLIDGIESVAEAFGAEWEFEGLKKAMTVINGAIQVLDALKTMVEAVQTIQKIADAQNLKSNLELAESNIAVAASEQIKSAAQKEATLTAAAETVATSEQNSENVKSVATNLSAAAASSTKASADATSAAAGAGKSVASIPYVGPILAVAAIAAVAAALLSAFSKFENGGIVSGTSFSGDKKLVRVNSGELILNRHQQRNLFDMLNSGVAPGGRGYVDFQIRGANLVGVLKNYNKIHR